MHIYETFATTKNIYIFEFCVVYMCLFKYCLFIYLYIWVNLIALYIQNVCILSKLELHTWLDHLYIDVHPM